MTMIDEEVLGDALRRAAESIQPSEDAMDRIMAVAQIPAASPRSARKLNVIPRSGRGRFVAVAAALALTRRWYHRVGEDFASHNELPTIAALRCPPKSFTGATRFLTGSRPFSWNRGPFGGVWRRIRNVWCRGVLLLGRPNRRDTVI